MYPRMQSISQIDETGIAKKEGLAIASPSTEDCEALPFRAAPWIPGSTAHPTPPSLNFLAGTSGPGGRDKWFRKAEIVVPVAGITRILVRYH